MNFGQRTLNRRKVYSVVNGKLDTLVYDNDETFSVNTKIVFLPVGGQKTYTIALQGVVNKKLEDFLITKNVGGQLQPAVDAYLKDRLIGTQYSKPSEAKDDLIATLDGLYDVVFAITGDYATELLNLQEALDDANDIFPLASQSFHVRFEASAIQSYGFDQFKDAYAPWTKDYQSVVMGKDNTAYSVANKSMADNAPDKVIAVLVNDKADPNNQYKDITLNDLHFKNGKGEEITTFSISGNQIILDLPGINGKDKIYAEFGDGNPIGKIKLKSYKRKQRRVTIVPLTSGLSIDTAAIRNKLNSIYQQAMIDWTVLVDDPMKTENCTSYDQLLDDPEVNGLAKYTEQMRAIRAEYLDANPDADRQSMLIFAIKGFKSDIKGYMVRGRGMGFVRADEITNNRRTLAHELCHGQFGVKHTFSDGLVKGKTNNLMDYPDNPQPNPELTLRQWRKIHNPLPTVSWFDGDEDGSLTLTQEIIEPHGIDCNGKIIGKYEVLKDFHTASPIISAKMPYLITGFNIYDQNHNKVQTIKCDDFESSTDILITYTTGSKLVNIYQSYGDGCFYRRQPIVYEYTTKEKIYPTIEAAITATKWEKRLLGNADESCVVNFVAEIIERDLSQECKSVDFINSGYNRILPYTNGGKTNATQLAVEVNNVCKSSLLKFNYTQLMALFDLIVGLDEIKENQEIAILRLMSCISTQNFSEFYRHLEANNNAISIHLINEMHDKSIYPWDGDNYTNYLGALTWMFKNNILAILDRFMETGNDKLLGQVYNVSGTPFIDDFERSEDLDGLLISMKNFRYTAEHDTSTGLVTIYVEEKVLTSTSIVPVWTVHRDQPIATVSPMTPLIISNKGGLPLVQTALGNTVSEVGNVYIVPAVFLSYKSDKEFVENMEKTGILMLDVITIASSGGTILATKVHWARRVWALMEVAGAVGNITVNTIEVPPRMKGAVDIYNATMGVIGIYHLGKGVGNFARNIPKITKDILKNNQKLRTALLASYVKWRVAVTELGQLSSAESKLIAKQRQVWSLLGIAGKGGSMVTRVLDNTADASIINQVKKLRQQLTSKYKKSGNFGYAEVEVIGTGKSEYYAHSSVQQLTGELPDRVPDICLKPKVEDELFPYSAQPTKSGDMLNRNVDTEYKILTKLAKNLGDDENVVGTLKLFTERAPCGSCSNVIDLFKSKYPYFEIEIIHNNGVQLIDF